MLEHQKDKLKLRRTLFVMLSGWTGHPRSNDIMSPIILCFLLIGCLIYGLHLGWGLPVGTWIKAQLRMWR